MTKGTLMVNTKQEEKMKMKRKLVLCKKCGLKP